MVGIEKLQKDLWKADQVNRLDKGFQIIWIQKSIIKSQVQWKIKQFQNLKLQRCQIEDLKIKQRTDFIIYQLLETIQYIKEEHDNIKRIQQFIHKYSKSDSIQQNTTFNQFKDQILLIQNNLRIFIHKTLLLFLKEECKWMIVQLIF
ncbi:unnamed protein product [Paramecium sonneborni]|uniref:Uncharacterized protein n=1 Tax=Paramecium sonneborni TaxID=65129 RepID=A0A8S1RP57_9CILI|nr:unnamed protein product [Paramecium sonneborni]